MSEVLIYILVFLGLLGAAGLIWIIRLLLKANRVLDMWLEKNKARPPNNSRQDDR